MLLFGASTVRMWPNQLSPILLHTPNILMDKTMRTKSLRLLVSAPDSVCVCAFGRTYLWEGVYERACKCARVHIVQIFAAAAKKMILTCARTIFRTSTHWERSDGTAFFIYRYPGFTPSGSQGTRIRRVRCALLHFASHDAVRWNCLREVCPPSTRLCKHTRKTRERAREREKENVVCTSMCTYEWVMSYIRCVSLQLCLHLALLRYLGFSF